MKKFTYILAGLILAAGLTACGGQDNTPAPTEPEDFQVSGLSDEAQIPAALADLSEEQLLLFEAISETDLEEAKQGLITLEKLDSSHADLLDVYIIEEQLPPNAHELYSQWKDNVGYYKQFAETEASPETTPAAPSAETSAPQ